MRSSPSLDRLDTAFRVRWVPDRPSPRELFRPSRWPGIPRRPWLVRYSRQRGV